MIQNLNVKIYADGAKITDMVDAYKTGVVKGFTTNPSLMKQAGVTDYIGFAKEAILKLPGLPISFEVFADDILKMEKEAEKIAQLGENVYIKIPIINTKCESTTPLISKLSARGYNLNITALLTLQQIEDAVGALAPNTKNVISVFAGRIADTGVDPIPTMKEAKKLCVLKPGTELLWASCREVYNIIQANDIGAEIITCPNSIINKLNMLGMDLFQVSLDTVKTFNKDISALGINI